MFVRSRLHFQLLAVANFATAQLHALVYRGPAACSGCPEAVANLLQSSPSKFEVTYAGPQEDVDINAETLSKVDVYAQAGGGNLGTTWPEMKAYSQDIRDFVSNGGRYMGFCLGAYLAGTPGFDLLPPPDNTNEESIQPGAEVKNDSNTIIQVDWHFSTGSLAGQTQKRWVFFQDGSVILLPNSKDSKILGRYSSNGDIAASLTPFGKGWVGATGPHPEADESWYTPYNLHNPDGINFDIGHDFVEITTHWKDNSNSAAQNAASTANMTFESWFKITVVMALLILTCAYMFYE